MTRWVSTGSCAPGEPAPGLLLPVGYFAEVVVGVLWGERQLRKHVGKVEVVAAVDVIANKSQLLPNP